MNKYASIPVAVSLALMGCIVPGCIVSEDAELDTTGAEISQESPALEEQANGNATALVGYCYNGYRAGMYCSSNVDCGKFCASGPKVNQYCNAAADCGKWCSSGPKVNQSCNWNSDCPGSTCVSTTCIQATCSG